MYNPCIECFIRHGHDYTEECDNRCEYANVISRLKPFDVEELCEIVKGKSLPVAFLSPENIENTYAIVKAAKDKLI